jgi:hypothetical protein
VAETSLARELVACPRHEQEECPRCDGSGFRSLKHCTGCGEPAGSISAGTGAPLVRSRENGEPYHLNCLPGFAGVVAPTTVEGMES